MPNVLGRRDCTSVPVPGIYTVLYSAVHSAVLCSTVLCVSRNCTKQKPKLLRSAEDGNLPSDPLAVGVLTERCAVAVKVHLPAERNPSLRPKCK